MISTDQWNTLESFRQGIEEEYNRNVLGKPERFHAYEETLGVLKASLDRYALDQTDSEQTFYFLAGVVSTLSFVGQYFRTVCHDPHMMAHLGEAAIFMGYLVRELAFECDAPYVGASE